MNDTLSVSQLAALSAAARKSAVSAATSPTSASSASAGSAAGSAGSTAADTSGTALSSLSSNFNDFLNLLTAQLQNQDPTTPMDSSQFTTELVQFTGVQQQVQANTNLTQLISLSQDQQLTQSSAMVGKTVTLTGSTVPLQSGGTSIGFDTPVAETVAVSITNSAGKDVKDVSLTSAAGKNTWRWDGTDNSGNVLPAGPYNVAIDGADQTGAINPITFTSTGIPTGVQKTASGLSVSFGATTLDYGDVQSVSQ